jgi:hypothetical protein
MRSRAYFPLSPGLSPAPRPRSQLYKQQQHSHGGRSFVRAAHVDVDADENVEGVMEVRHVSGSAGRGGGRFALMEVVVSPRVASKQHKLLSPLLSPLPAVDGSSHGVVAVGDGCFEVVPLSTRHRGSYIAVSPPTPPSRHRRRRQSYDSSDDAGQAPRMSLASIAHAYLSSPWAVVVAVLSAVMCIEMTIRWATAAPGIAAPAPPAPPAPAPVPVAPAAPAMVTMQQGRPPTVVMTMQHRPTLQIVEEMEASGMYRFRVDLVRVVWRSVAVCSLSVSAAAALLIWCCSHHICVHFWLHRARISTGARRACVPASSACETPASAARVSAAASRSASTYPAATPCCSASLEWRAAPTCSLP